MDAIVLAGGRGTRLTSLPRDLPKSLAPVNGRPFLDFLLAELASCELIGSVVIALGYLAPSVIDHYRATPAPLPLRFAVETQPLGTAGAIRNALPHTAGDIVVACNGDSLVHVDLRSLIELRSKSRAQAALAVVHAQSVSRYGSVRLNRQFVTGFAEKASGGAGLVSAGVYVFHRRIFDDLPPGQLSMEHDVLPSLAGNNHLVALEVPGPLLDIGLPETYAAASEFVRQFERSAHS